MSYASGQWGKKAKDRSKNRLQYFKKARKGFRKGNHLKLKGENIARGILIDAIYVDESSHDFEWRGQKVEVKAANPQPNGRWYFNKSNVHQEEADYFLLIFLVKDKFLTSYLVPGEEITSKFCISCNRERFSEYEIDSEKLRA